MTKTPTFRILAGVTDITETVLASLDQLTYRDESGKLADELEIRLAGRQRHWDPAQQITFFMGYRGQALWRFGTFTVLTSTMTSTGLVVRATSVDFNSGFKVKKSRGWEGKTLGGIVRSIAQEHGLAVKCDYDDIQLSHIAQPNESDMQFLRRQAELYDALFTIKNSTLLFRRREKAMEKNGEFPTFAIDIADTTSWSITRNSRAQYRSCTAVWMNPDTGKPEHVTVGSGEPVQKLDYPFQNAAQAQEAAWAMLQRHRRETLSGRLRMEGAEIYAGGLLELTGTPEDNRPDYTIKSVEHTLDTQNGWQMNITFEG